MKQYFKRIIQSFSFLKGFSVTVKYFFQPKRIVTEQYPENKATLKMYPRFRGRLEMVEDENGENRCTACGMCEKSCPNGSINVLPTKNIAGKKVLGKYIYRLDTCTQCGFCVETCPFGAIRMNQDFELADFDRSHFELKLNQKEGRA
ncbi:MAG: NADH-quinone oxidoreductase subunit I [Hallerella porci]|uniref:NADH-quinone oxidoreductase subunit I n=2 Tax=Fibrobacteraceae TaxID=204431 RepID=A0ABX5LMW0_9BACT|nr:NADH-quinone oxidoreductase subunit I [Hallerella porci]MCI5601637.1 NADH-quinone oxidoreductase subunit I [Hallerella sp.]MDY3921024.1 NADH-quinone oxidoreductase subunit I [Hallerella porci]PWL03775.1 NADH dehydrogenase subunit I [Hallerella porci]